MTYTLLAVRYETGEMRIEAFRGTARRRWEDDSETIFRATYGDWKSFIKQAAHFGDAVYKQARFMLSGRDFQAAWKRGIK